MLGKAGMHELAYGVTSNNPHYGAVHNPWDLDLIPGGSSGGSAAARGGGVGDDGDGDGHGRVDPHPRILLRRGGTETDLRPAGSRGRVSALGHAGPRGTTGAHGSRCGCGVPCDGGPRNTCAGDGWRSPLPIWPRRIAHRRSPRYFFDRVEAEVGNAVRNAAGLAEVLGAQVTFVQLPDVEALNVLGRVVQLAEAAAVFAGHLDPALNRRADFRSRTCWRWSSRGG